MVSSILPKKRTKLTILSSFVRFFGRIEETKICFRDLLTFSKKKKDKKEHARDQEATAVIPCVWIDNGVKNVKPEVTKDQ
jgi:hypothetical protein